MNRLLLEIYLPYLDEKHDFFVPDAMETGLLAQLAASTFAKMYPADYVCGPTPILCTAAGVRLPQKRRLYEENIENGTRLILF